MRKNTKIYVAYIFIITINFVLGTLFLSFKLEYGGGLIPVFWRGAGLGLAVMIYLIINFYERGMMVEVGLWNRGRKKEWAFEIFTDLITEEFDKTFLYHYFQKKRNWILEECTEIRFFTLFPAFTDTFFAFSM